MTDWQEKTEDELLAELDSLLYGSDDQLSGRELREALARSRLWVQQWMERHREKLCAAVKRRHLDLDGFVEVGTVADIIVQQAHLSQASAAVLAAILMKRGLGAICSDIAIAEPR